MSTTEIIKIHEKGGQKLVNARELHQFLESKQQFTDWIKNRIEKYGFIEGEDYTSFHKIMKRENGASTKKEYGLTLDTAKEISMVENNEKGKEARRYFIKMERMAQKVTVSLPDRKELARWVVEAEETIELQKEQLQIQAPKVNYHDGVLQSQGTYVTNQIAKEMGMSARSLNQLLNELKIQYKSHGTWVLYSHYQNKDYTRTNTYMYQGHDGDCRTSMQTVWTEKGRKFIHNAVMGHKRQLTI